MSAVLSTANYHHKFVGHSEMFCLSKNSTMLSLWNHHNNSLNQLTIVISRVQERLKRPLAPLKKKKNHKTLWIWPLRSFETLTNLLIRISCSERLSNWASHVIPANTDGWHLGVLISKWALETVSTVLLADLGSVLCINVNKTEVNQLFLYWFMISSQCRRPS